MNHTATTRSAALERRARAVMPGGVSSPVRAFTAVGGSPRYVQAARGCTLIDADGTRLIDYIGAWGAAIVGHAHPAVVAAIERAARDGASFGTCSPGEVDLAEAICARVPSVERVRFTNSGTEAVMTALRLARAVTGRDLVVKFDGCYHGHVDAMLVRAGSGAATLGLPDSAGVPRGISAGTVVARYNDAASVEEAFRRHPDRIAAVIVEPVAGNMGLVPPVDGFLASLRAITLRHGAILIFDEVMTGFRVARGGAQSLYATTPELTTFGKIIGGGLPVGAVGGAAGIMDLLAPAGPVYQAGTFSGNPLTMAAGLATLELLDDDAYAMLDAHSARLEHGLSDALERLDAPVAVQRVGSMLCVYFDASIVRTMDDARRCDHRRFAGFFHAMLDRGVHLPPGGYESWFVSLAHDHAAIDATIAAARAATATIADDLHAALITQPTQA